MSEQDKVSMSSTLVAGSDEDFDVICDPCNSDGQRVQATGHCIDCNVNMCVSCLKFHKKLPSVKNHIIKDKSTLSQSHMANKRAEDKDPLTDRCTIHPDELIKFYCNSHQKLCCCDCVSLDHRQCEDILYIKNVSSGVANSDELAKIQADLKMLVARLTRTQRRDKWTKQAVNGSHSQIVADIRNLKMEIINMLDRYENEILKTASHMNKEKTDTLNCAISACASAIGESEGLIADLEKKKRTNRSKSLFISMKNAQNKFRDLAAEAEILCNKNEYERWSFQPDEKLSNLLSTLTGLGCMFRVEQPTKATAKYQHNISIKTDRDAKDCGISGMRILSDGRLALTDELNMTMKIVDVTKRKVAEEIKLDSPPLDLARITAVKIAVTLLNKRYIQVLSVSPALSKSHTITVSSLYFGIEYIPDKLILVCREPTSAVHICDMSGVVLQQIETDYSGNKLFTKASRIAISPDHGVMYVSDVVDNTVVCLTMDGKLISKYASDMLKDPVGIDCDYGGFAYVCSEQTDTVHQLSHSGQLVKILLEEKDHIAFPFAIAYSAGNLYISRNENGHRNFFQVYKLEQNIL